MEELEEQLRKQGRALNTARSREGKERDASRLLASKAAAAGISQRRIAELLGVDRMTVRKWVGKR